MSHRCKYCNKELIKNDEIILEGPYPGASKKLFSFMFYSNLRDYGEISHRDCFFRQATDDKLLLKLISKIESSEEKKAK